MTPPGVPHWPWDGAYVSTLPLAKLSEAHRGHPRPGNIHSTPLATVTTSCSGHRAKHFSAARVALCLPDARSHQGNVSGGYEPSLGRGSRKAVCPLLFRPRGKALSSLYHLEGAGDLLPPCSSRWYICYDTLASLTDTSQYRPQAAFTPALPELPYAEGWELTALAFLVVPAGHMPAQ